MRTLNGFELAAVSGGDNWGAADANGGVSTASQYSGAGLMGISGVISPTAYANNQPSAPTVSPPPTEPPLGNVPTFGFLGTIVGGVIGVLRLLY